MLTSLFTFFCPYPWPVQTTIEKLRKRTEIVRGCNLMKKGYGHIGAWTHDTFITTQDRKRRSNQPSHEMLKFNF